MFTKQQASQIKQQFWTSFGQYMAPVPAAEGLRINWVNYKTGIKELYFKMEADNSSATIAIVMAHADAGRQEIFYKKFTQLKNVLSDALQEEWQWAMHVPDENNKTISRICTSLDGINIFRKEDWPAIISFFKPRIMALDAFWNEAKYGFDNL